MASVSGTFLSRLKKSKIVPIFKSGYKNDIKNYRPIVPSNLSEIFESIL